MNRESQVLAKIRSEVCNAILVWLSLCTITAMAAFALRRPEFVSPRMVSEFAGIGAILVATTLLRHRLPYPVRASTILVLGTAIGLSRLMAYGAPYGLIDFALTVIMTTVFFGERISIAVFIALLVSLGGSYLAFTYGLIPAPTHVLPPLAASTWVATAGVLVATTLGPSIAISRYGNQLDLERQHAEQANAAKSQFLAMMSHEFRTPLNAIIGFTEALNLGYGGSPASPRYQEYIEDIHRSARHLLKIVDDLLNLARIDAHQYKPAVEEVDVCAAVATAMATVDVLAATAQLVLRSELDTALPSVLADPQLVQQVLLNLLSNAIKFTPVKGTVTVRAKTLPDVVRIEVSDTGIGIPADQIPNLGQPFQQAKHPTVRTKEGSGLGLALAKLFTELQGGHLAISSTVGEGTTVGIDLPRVPRSDPA